MRITWVNMGGCTDTNRRARFVEPVHLVPMHNIAKKHGHESHIIYSRDLLLARATRPEVLALSYIGHSEEDIRLGRQLVESFPEAERLRLFVGGSDVEYHCGAYLAAFGDLYPQDPRDALTLVVGPGEGVVEALAPHGFSIFTKNNLDGLGRVMMDHGRPILFGGKGVPLKEQDFTRPYENPWYYEGRSQLKLATGCAHSCGFCPNVPAKADYQTVAQAKREVEQVIRLGARRGAISAANFLANPKQGTELLSAISSLLPLSFSARVDSLDRAITRWPAAWKKIRRGGHSIELGVESLLPLRLLRIDKHRRLEAAARQNERLERILRFFEYSSIEIYADLILFDPGMWLGELITETEMLLSLQAQYGNFHIDSGSVANRLGYAPGSPFAEKMEPIDFWNYRRDPRCLLLCLVIHKMTQDIYGKFFANMYLEPEPAVSTNQLLEYMRRCAITLHRILPDQFRIDEILALLQSGGSDLDILEALFSQIPRDDRAELQASLGRNRYQLFPQFFLEPRQGLF